MKKRIKFDILELARSLQKQLIGSRPTPSQMYEEVRMMNFVVKPLQGDITKIDLKNSKLIEALWSLGKLDEFFQNRYDGVPKKHKENFVKLINNLHKQFQLDLNRANLTLEKPIQNPILEMEIFKKHPPRKKTN